MKTFKDKTCLICGTTYTPTGNSSKYCEPCRKPHWKYMAAGYTRDYKIRKGLVKNPGIGSGNGAGSGKNHHSYKNGLGCDFPRLRKEIKEEQRYCERCNLDLLYAPRHNWCTHHRDHNRNNNIKENLELLCKRCHQLEHDCVNAFGTCND